MNTKRYLVNEAPLHIRRASKLSQDYILGTLPKGFTIEVTGEVYGEEYKYKNIRSNIWLKDIHGFYYWKGGVIEQNPVIGQPPKKELHKIAYQGEAFEYFISNCYKKSTLYSQIDYFDFLQIPPFPEEIKRKVLIGLIDHPISSALPTNKQVIHISGKKMEPSNQHATALAGLIGGAGDIKGIAKFMQIVELPIFDGRANQPPGLTKEIIGYIENETSKDPHLRIIINVSYNFGESYFQELSPLIDNPSVILIAAAGTDSQLVSKIKQIPACKAGVIAVGTVSEGFRNQNPRPDFDPKLDIIMPHFKYPSYGTSSYFDYTGEDSAATAIVSALASLVVQHTELSFTVKDIKERLLTFSKPYTQSDSFKKLNLINPFL